jgi:GT2 family glycosyltransferase
MQQDIEQYTKFDFDTKIQFGLNRINNIKVTRPVFNLVEHNKINCSIIEDNFTFYLGRNRFKENVDTTIIICSKDNGKILDYTLNILQQYLVNVKYDILLVDDRSISNDILELSDKYKASYLKITNNNNIFSYSAINNIAVKYIQNLDKQLIVFYNNDLWPATENAFDNLINKHRQYKSDITGCKLLYPNKTAYENLGKPTHLLEPYLDNIFETIQHGGIHFILRESDFIDARRKYYGDHVVLSPSHLWRFYNNNTYLASIDSQCFAVTGAIQIIETNTFIDLGGFDNGLCTAFQDIDLCMKAIEKHLKVYYIGSEHMYHAESLTQAIEKDNYAKTINSDNIMWDVKWGLKLPFMLGFKN